jgi:penicillin-binding protein 2
VPPWARTRVGRYWAERVIERSRTRLTVIGVVVMFLFSVLFARLWFLQVASGSSSTAAATSNSVRVIHEPALRGRILDREGTPIVDNQPADVITLDRGKPGDTAERNRVIGRLAKVLGVTDEEVKKRIDDPRASPVAPARIAVGIPPEVRNYLEEREADFPGVEVVRTAVRAYPNGPLAANLLGYVAEINRDELELHAKDGYREGDLIGKDGVEQMFERVLRGTPRKLKVEVDSRGRVIDTIEDRKALPGNDVQLTIDIDAQRVAEQSLAQAMDGARGVQDQGEERRFQTYRAGAGSVVVLDPNDGSVVAMASNPTYDPSQLAAGITPEQFEMLNSPGSNFPLLNRAVSGEYAPGSTFKIFTSIAALETGQLDPDAGFVDQGYLDIGGDPPQRRYNARRTAYGTVNLQRALTVSSDAYFYDIGRDMWQPYNKWLKASNAGQQPNQDDIKKGYAIQDTAETYGFGQATGLGLRGEADGRVPDQAWKERLNANEPDPQQRRERSLWLPGDNVSLAVGQGDLLVTPLQLATGYATFANGGTLFTPRVAKAVLEPGTGSNQPQPVVRELPPQPVRQTGLKPETREVIMGGLIGVTSNSEGTARGAFQGFNAGTVAGKTGTAEHTEANKQDDSLFAGITHPESPQYVVLAVVEEGGFGASVAAPIARRVIETLEGNTSPTAVNLQLPPSGD